MWETFKWKSHLPTLPRKSNKMPSTTACWKETKDEFKKKFMIK